ncbi:MAG: hypothetical protein H6585_03575 [Flavobacteriales bacterium]|nr:hypothetical protein [Flavobacteriales bacterium]MCB9447408.1 hypothetical protein [Flavobacteriales bacterium]
MRSVVICILILLPGWLMQAYGQAVLMEEDVAGDTVPDMYGPNRRHFVFEYVGFGSHGGQAEKNGRINGASSIQSRLGYTYKLRINQLLATGISLGYAYDVFAIKQTDNKAIPDTVRHSSEKMRFHLLTSNAFFRISLSPRRGNILGNYIDLGGYGNCVLGANHKTIDDMPDGTRIKTVVSREGLHETLQYGLFSKLGFQFVVIFAEYRMSDLFKANRNIPETPRFMAGIEFNLPMQ